MSLSIYAVSKKKQQPLDPQARPPQGVPFAPKFSLRARCYPAPEGRQRSALVLGCSAKIHLVVSREMNWAVVETVFKAMVALGAVTFFVVSKAGGPEEVVEQAIQLAESDPFLLLYYTFGAVVATVVIYAMISLAIVLDSPDSRGERYWWRRR